MHYPNLLRRYFASTIDLTTVIFIVYLYSMSPLYHPDGKEKMLVPLTVLALYEPLMTVFFCTLGQAVMKFRVRDSDNLARITILQAYIRLVVKYFLGIISFLTMPAREDRCAIHDLAGRTIVIEANMARTIGSSET